MMKLFDGENKRLVIVLTIILVILLFILLYNKVESTGIIKEVENLIKSNDPKLIYIMRDGCGYCELNENNIKQLEKDYNLAYYKIDTDKLSKTDYSKLLEMLSIDESKFGTPHMTVVQTGKVIDELSGLTSYEILFNFLKTNNIISSDSKLYLNYPDLEEYNELITKANDEVIVLALSYCKYCLGEQPYLIDIAKKYNVKINYVYLDYLFSSKEEYNQFLTSLSWYSENEDWGTPTILIVNNKKVKKSLESYHSSEDIVNFFKDNEIIK